MPAGAQRQRQDHADEADQRRDGPGQRHGQPRPGHRHRPPGPGDPRRHLPARSSISSLPGWRQGPAAGRLSSRRRPAGGSAAATTPGSWTASTAWGGNWTPRTAGRSTARSIWSSPGWGCRRKPSSATLSTGMKRRTLLARALVVRRPTSSCSTSPPTTWTSMPSPGWKISWPPTAAPSSSSPTTACWCKNWPAASSRSTAAACWTGSATTRPS